MLYSDEVFEALVSMTGGTCAYCESIIATPSSRLPGRDREEVRSGGLWTRGFRRPCGEFSRAWDGEAVSTAEPPMTTGVVVDDGGSDLHRRDAETAEKAPRGPFFLGVTSASSASRR